MGYPFPPKMTLKDRYGFGGFSGTPPSEPNLSTPPPPPPGYLCEERTSEDARQDIRWSPPERRLGVGRASTDLLINYRPKLGRRPSLYRPGFARLPFSLLTGTGRFLITSFRRAQPEPRPKCDRVYISSKKYAARLPGEFEIRRRSGDLQFRPEIVGYVDVGITAKHDSFGSMS